jgi:hypothetical protein
MVRTLRGERGGEDMGTGLAKGTSSNDFSYT